MQVIEDTNRLICDASRPLISQGKLLEELLLYNISVDDSQLLMRRFMEISGREIYLESETDYLSGGQKVLLMFLLAIGSPARNLHFIGLFHSLDALVSNRVQTLMIESSKKKTITSEDAPLED